MSTRSIQFSDRGSDFEPDEATIYEDESVLSSALDIGAGERYTLLPLNKDSGELRLIQLLPSANPSNPLECKLYVVSRNDGPLYTALSYAWGSVIHPAVIKVNGLDWYITENLHSALLHIRDVEEPVTLWVDAICIDQKNDEEKSWHVQQMRETFSEASEVLAWLGASNNTDEAMRLLQRIGEAASEYVSAEDAWTDKSHTVVTERYTEAIKYGVSQETRAEKLFLSIVNKESNDMHFQEPATLEIFSRPWWKRVWVVQELAVSSSLHFQCGTFKIGAAAMLNAALLYYQHTTSVWGIEADLTDRSKVQERLIDHIYTPLALIQQTIYAQCTTRQAYRTWAHSAPGLPLAYLLSSTFAYGSTRVLEATDPRDYVYAVLGLASDTKELGIIADYTKSNNEVFIELSRALIRHGYFVALSWCRTKGFRHGLALPSWAIDLSRKIERPFQWLVRSPDQRSFILEPEYAAGIGLHETAAQSLAVPSVAPPSTGVLQLQGILFDRISYTGSSFDELHSRSEPGPQVVTRACIRFLRELKALLEGSVGSSPYTTDLARAAAIWSTAIADVEILPTWQKKRWGGKNGEAKLSPEQKMLFTANFPMEHMLEGAKSIYNGLFATMDSVNLSRRPFLTAKGYIGLAPTEAAPGDSVVVISGAQMPFVCRTDDGGLLKLVGDAYVHGIMDGEIMAMQHTHTHSLSLY